VDEGHPIVLGEGVTVGHGAVVHGATIGDSVLVGMGSTVMNGATIGNDVLVAAGAVVTEGMVVPPRSLVAGVPAKVRRTLTDAEVNQVRGSAGIYEALRELHRGGVVVERSRDIRA
jgi:carbonic anhydrase/acetyltransferase-like protein (isoleucine patch superfamily)